MRMLPLTQSLLAFFSILSLTTRLAQASNPSGGCTEQTYGAACNHDGTSPCSGVCLPDFSQSDVPMACLPADTTLVQAGGNPPLTGVVEGQGCSPTGSVGSDCAHSCRSGQCVATSATSGAECQPVGASNVCVGACDGAGTCNPVPLGGDEYGRQFSSCDFLACNPTKNNGAGHQFAVPEGTTCDNEEQCEIDDKCNAEGFCIGTQDPDCTPKNEDAGSDDTGDDSDDDAGTEHPDAKVADAGKKHDAGVTATPTSDGGGGCSVGGTGGVWLLSLVPWLAILGRRRRTRRDSGKSE